MNKEKLTEIGLVALCGLVGGLLAWLLGIAAIASGERFTSLIAALLGGAIAAGVGVYLIAHTDTSTVVKEIVKNEQKFPEAARKTAASALEQISAASEKK